jgi:hypothetical protein
MRTLLTIVVLAGVLHAQETKPKHDFPTDEEIKLAVLQSERAVADYKQAVALEASLPTTQKDATSLDTDKHLIELFPKLLEAIKQTPSRFDGLAGLLLLTTLDDASRNAALCGNSAMGDIAQELLSTRDTAKIYRIMAISQKCIDTSTELYTVSESVHALYVKATEAQEELSQEAEDTLNKCVAALQKGKK